MKVKWLSMKSMQNNNFGVLDLIAEMGDEQWKFFKKVVWLAKDDTFISSKHKDAIKQELNIKETTYFKRLKQLEDDKVIIKASRGVYEFNTKWIRVLSLDIGVQGADKKMSKSHQKLLSLRIELDK